MKCHCVLSNYIFLIYPFLHVLKLNEIVKMSYSCNLIIKIITINVFKTK